MCLDSINGGQGGIRTDTELVNDVLAGRADLQAVTGEFNRRYLRRLTYFGLNYTSSRPLAEEAANDAVYALHRKLAGLAGPPFDVSSPNSVYSYLCYVARNQVFLLTRLERKMQKRIDRYAARGGPVVPDVKRAQEAADDAIDGFADSPVGHDVRIAMRCLTADQRRLLYGFHIEGKRAEDIAFELGVAPGTVYNHLKQAEHRLREKLKQLWDDYERQT